MCYLCTAVNLTSNNNNYILSNPIGRIATTAARGWTDSNGNWNPDCDLRNQAAQNLTAVGGDICAASNAQTFGTTTQTTANIDPKILTGWSVRSNDWQIGASVQQQVLPRVWVEIATSAGGEQLRDHRQSGHFRGDYTPYSIRHRRIRDCPRRRLYRRWPQQRRPEPVRPDRNNITLADDIGDQYQMSDGMLSTSARARRSGSSSRRASTPEDDPGQLRRAHAGTGAADAIASVHPAAATSPNYTLEIRAPTAIRIVTRSPRWQLHRAKD